MTFCCACDEFLAEGFCFPFVDELLLTIVECGESAEPFGVVADVYRAFDDFYYGGYDFLCACYEEAEVYLSGQDAGKYRIVSPDPMVSPVPLAALERYRLVYSSEELTEHLERNWIPTVKIFEYTSEADQIVRMETDD